MRRTEKTKLYRIALHNIAWGIFWVAALVFAFLFVGFTHRSPEVDWGVTFSKLYAQSLGLNWREAYLATLDELQVTHIRIPVYWNDVALQKGTVMFDDYAFMLEEAQKRGVQVIMVVGSKVPRWPECYIPGWVSPDSAEFADTLLGFVRAEVDFFKHYDVITMWQVENEPFIGFFGKCPRITRMQIEKEIALVRSLDDRPVLVTDSGELSSWLFATFSADVFGFTVYRATWNPLFGYTRYPLSPLSYARKTWLLRKIHPELTGVIDVELQLEPWVKSGAITTTPPAELGYTMSLQQFRKNIRFARDTGIAMHYVWGVEWWYYQKLHGDPGYWNEAKKLW